MAKEYVYHLQDCDIDAADRSALEAFRAKRAEWLDRLREDEHHAISIAVSEMLWADVRFRTIAKIGELEPEGALSNQLLMEALIDGHFATQVLAVRRLMDDPRNGVISLFNLLKDVAANAKLFTRENYVCFDGLPYDHHAAQQRVMRAMLGAGSFWGAQTGPDAWQTSQRAHEMFDRLAGIGPAARSRKDCLPPARIATLQSWLTNSGAEKLVDWSNHFLAHAGDRNRRGKLDMAAAQPDLKKITEAMRSFVRVTEALLGCVLFDSGHGEVVPVPQFNQFEFLDRPALTTKNRDEVRGVWDELTSERNTYLEGVIEELTA